MDFSLVLSVVVFVAAIGIIISEKMNRTVVAVAGAAIIMLAKVLNGKGALEYVDFNTIGVLIGMMIIVGVIQKTGVFQYMAIVAAKKAKGDPWKIIVGFCIITMVTSAVLNNVTTVLLMVPMTFVITQTLELDPIPFLIPEILASNIGGTATLIGDPPNIMIGSAVNLSFADFLLNLGPIVLLIFVVTMVAFKFVYGKRLIVSEEKKKQILLLDESKAITEHVLLVKCLIILALVIIGFLLPISWGYSAALVSIVGATILLIISRENLDEIFNEVEWSTIFFFGGLFIMVGGLEATGVIDLLSNVLINITDGHMLLTGVLLVWFSAIFSAFLDNIPLVATLIPLVQSLGAKGIDVTPLWWAIALGACLGGNGTLIGASANVVVAGLAEKQGHKLSFGMYIKIGFPMMILSVAIACIYVVIRYL